MNDSTRRGFLAVAGAAAAAGTAVALVPTAAAAEEDSTLPAGVGGSMAAYVRDLAKGEVVLMTKGKEVTVIDKVLAARLARAFARV